MQVSYNWLQEYVSIPWSPEELGHRLTMAGVAVEHVYTLGEDLSGVITARITAIEDHREADNLLVAQMDLGQGDLVQVVTGAKNVKVGDVVPLATVGASLPGGQTIGEAQLKGVLSQGMMCSAEELNLEPSPVDEGGIMILPPDIAVGEPIAKVLGLDDYILELDLTPNRGDCLSMVGVAREVAALTGQRIQLPPVAGGADEQLPEPFLVTVVDNDLCHRYSGRILTDIKIGPSPLWMQQRLRGAGMRPINNMVDVTNYVMLELGQPLHAFDQDKVEGQEIIVRRAWAGEKLVTLDEQERSLQEDMLLITDSNGPIGVAGVMGGANSEVTPKTQRVVLESASFANINIRRTARTLGLRSEASSRFEKGVDPNGTLFAANRAAYLMEQMGAAQVAAGAIDVYPQVIEPRRITARPNRINALLGTNLSPEQQKDILVSLEFSITGEGPFTVAVPTFRPDIELEQDLAEEVARIYGYNNIPGTMLRGNLTAGGLTQEQRLTAQVKGLLAGWGLREIITYSFYSPRHEEKMGLNGIDRRPIPLLHPLSEEQAVMRTSLVPNILDTIAFNMKRKNNDLALFELGNVYWGNTPLEELPQEPRFLSIAVVGQFVTPHWGRTNNGVDFFTLKGIVEAVVTELGCKGSAFKVSDHPAFHPRRQAALYLEDTMVGVLGEIHPDVAEAWGIGQRAYVAELAFDPLVTGAQVLKRYRQLPRFPAVVWDMALVVDEDVAAAQVAAVIVAEGGDLLFDFTLFDHYQGDQVPQGKKSLAYSLVYQASDRTLTEEEVGKAHNRIKEALVQELGAQPRE